MSETETGTQAADTTTVVEPEKAKRGKSKGPTIEGTQGLKQGRYTLKVHPDQAIIIGVDTEHKQGEHDLWDERSFWPLVEKTIEFTSNHGIMEPPELRYEDGIGLTVVDGRRRFLHLRAANERRVKAGVPPITEVECFIENTPMSLSRMHMWAKNIHREEETLLSKCRKVRDALMAGVSEVEAMDIFKASNKSVLQKWKKIAMLPDEFQALIEKFDKGLPGGMSAEAALAHHKAGKPAEAPVEEVKEAAAKKAEAPAKAPDEDGAAKKGEKGAKGKKSKKTLKVAAKKGTAADALGKRGKKWFKVFCDMFNEYIPQEYAPFLDGVRFGIQAIEDKDLPAKLYNQVIAYKVILGQETNEEEKALPAYMRKQIEKMQAAQSSE